jgi:DNA-binding CsgD family transcriptional regulator/tetratricopeptide (TPR) repeat protein
VPVDPVSSELLGRRREQDVLVRLLREVKAGQSRVLVLHGDAGAGKTALLDYVAQQASAFRVIRVAGVEQESELAYSALQLLCAPLLPYASRLPQGQQDALFTAFGLRAGSPPGQLMVGMATLGLLAEAAQERPLVCLVDDTQWLDRHSRLTLTFLARRLGAESVALVFAARIAGEDHPDEQEETDGLPELPVRGLPDAEARALLDSALSGPVDPPVRDRIVAETRGNPLALLELPRGLSPAELAFGFGGYGATTLASRVEMRFQHRIAALPADTRKLLLTAAVEPVGDASLLWRALRRLGVEPDAVTPAEAAGLVELGTRVRFRHPLVRSAAWRAADAAVLREVHASLAHATDPQRDPDRRAWHRAHAAVGPDEDVASELVRSADRAQARGGRSAAASFLERAAALTPDPKQRAGRALAAARARLDAGSPARVHDLLAIAELGPLDALQRAEVARLRAQVSFMINPGVDAGPPLLAAALRLTDLDPAAARETYLAALGAAMWAGRLDEGGMRRAAEAARQVPPDDDMAGLFLRGLIAWSLDGAGPAVPLLSAALSSFAGSDDLGLLWLAAMASMELCDLESWLRVTERAVRFARVTGMLSILPAALSYRAGALTFAGRSAEAWDALDEAAVAGQATGLATYMVTGVVMSAYQGRERKTLEQVEVMERDAEQRGMGRLFGVAGYTRAVLYNGRGNYPAAMEAARRAVEYPDLTAYGWTLSEMVEAAVRSGDVALAAQARDRLTEWSSSGTPWALGARLLADALAGPAAQAEDRYREAIEQFAHGNVTLMEARARLLYGEWLRRDNRRVQARIELRAAHDALTSMDAEAFAERAGRELAATGEKVRKRILGVPEPLTSQESQIVRQAVAGRSNPEIAAALFLSPRTVEWHLRKVFGKLGISSRRELAAALREQ